MVKINLSINDSIGVLIGLLIGIVGVGLVVNITQESVETIDTWTKTEWVKVTGETTDAGIYNGTWGKTYAQVHDAHEGYTNKTQLVMKIGQNLSGTKYLVHRCSVVFDVKSKFDADFESGYVIKAIPTAYLELMLIGNYSTADFGITMQVNASLDFPHTPAVPGDYNYSSYSGNHGTFANTTALPALASQFNTTMTTAGKTFIKNNYASELKWMLRSSRDIASTTPLGDEWIVVSQADDTGNEPTLYVRAMYDYSVTSWTFTGGSGARTLMLIIPFLYIASVIIWFVGRLFGKW